MQNSDIRVSVCIPTYNKYDTIEYTILSVINQLYSNWELKVVDDSNNDHTEKIVRKYSKSDSRIQYIKNNERLGLVKNWNECIKQANYEYVYILHHDDFLLQGVLQAYNDFLKIHPNCGLVHSNCYAVSLPYYTKEEMITQKQDILKGDGAIEKILFNNNIACSSVMVKKECYEKLGNFDEQAWVSPDWEMWARIGKTYDIGHMNIVGCTVVFDNSNTHLSAININTLYQQQQYYYKKIISYFSDDYANKNYLVFEQAEENLKKTIYGLSCYYIENYKLLTAFSYLKKINFYNFSHLLTCFPKLVLKRCIIPLIRKKKNYRQVFQLLWFFITLRGN